MEFECRRCQRPVEVNAEYYDVFERMHYVCFHYEFEHGEFDVDQECTAGGCPSASLAKGHDEVIATARQLADEIASGAPWANPELHEYLGAFAAWLADRRTMPERNGWEVVNDALRAATDYD